MKIYVEHDGVFNLREYDLPVVQIGRGKDNQLVISDPRSSRHHCRILHTPHGYFLEDLKSRNGTLLNGEKVTRQELREGDCIQIGAMRLHFETPPSGATAPTTPASAPAQVSETDAAATAPVAAKPGAARKRARGAESVVTTGEVYLEGIDGPYAGRKIPVTKVPYTIGRKTSNDFRVDDKKTSGKHARIVRRGDAFWIEDLQSRNGTFVNGRQVEESPLVPGCRVHIGDVHFHAHVPAVQGVSLDDATFRDEAVGSDVVAEDDFSRFNVQEFLHEADASRQQPLVLVGILLVMGAILYFTVDVTLKRVERRRPDPAPAGNRIAANWSFEDKLDAAGAVPGWSLLGDGARVSLSTRDGVQWPGRKALVVEPAGDGVQLVQVASEPSSVDPDSPCYVSGHVLNRGSFASGLLVSWLRISGDGLVEIDRTYSPAMRQPGEEGDVLVKVRPPRSTTHARVACFVLQGEGGGAGAVFDRIYFGKTPPDWLVEEPVEAEAGDSAPAGAMPADAMPADAMPTTLADPTTIEAAPKQKGSARPLRAELHPDGSLLDVRRGPLPAIARIVPTTPFPGDPLALGPALVEPVIYGRNGGMRLTTQVPDVASGQWVPVEIQTRSTGDEIRSQFRFQKPRGAEELPAEVAVALVLAPGVDERGAFDADGNQVAIGAERSRTPATELVFGRGREQIVVQFDPPVTLREVAPGGDRLRPALIASVSPPGRKTRDVEVTISTASRQEDIAVQGLLDRARALRELGQFAGALDLLADVRRRFPWRDLGIVDDMERRINEESHAAADGLRRELELLQRLGSPFVHQAMRERGEALSKRFAGSVGAAAGVKDKVDALLTSADALWKSRQSEAPEARRLFEAGTKLFEQGQVHLAELFLQEARRFEGGDPDMYRRIEELFDRINIRKRGEARGTNP